MAKDKLVCIFDEWQKVGGGIIEYPCPVLGDVYTFEAVDPWIPEFILLVEFPQIVDGHRNAWDADCFRPVDYTFGEKVEATIMKDAELQEA